MKNQKMKKVFSMLLTAILAASTLAACGRGNQSEKQEGSIATATKSEEESFLVHRLKSKWLIDPRKIW